MFSHFKIWLGGLVVMFVISACSPRALRHAEAVVREADSLWMSGQRYNDSTELAQAYTILDEWQWICPDAYIHSCYHYGRLLRDKEDPVSAMQVFINATHARTSDYHILGRVYSNMGSICHLACAYPLSYDMYEQSAEMFLKNGDTLNYYYALNDMAFEKAETGDSIATMSIICKIDTMQQSIVPLLDLTLAELFLKTKHYLFAIQHANKLLHHAPNLSITPYLILAQSYSYLGCNDSAVYYANAALSMTNEKYVINNALYILTNKDESKGKDDIRKIAANRADTQKLIEIQQRKLSQAVQLLEQDLNRKPNRHWIIAILLTIILIGCIVGLYVYYKRKRHALLSQEIEHLENTYNDMQNARERQIRQLCETLRASSNISRDLNWKDFNKMCLFVNEHFYFLASKLQQTNTLNETEIRLCVLVLIGLSRTQIAEVLPYASNSVGKLKDHTAKLLGTTGKNLHDFLVKKAIGG